MSMMNTELYDALLDAGASDDKARSAAITVGDVNQLAKKSDIARLEAKTNLVHWMVGFNLALTAAGLLALIVK